MDITLSVAPLALVASPAINVFCCLWCCQLSPLLFFLVSLHPLDCPIAFALRSLSNSYSLSLLALLPSHLISLVSLHLPALCHSSTLIYLSIYIGFFSVFYQRLCLSYFTGSLLLFNSSLSLTASSQCHLIPHANLTYLYYLSCITSIYLRFPSYALAGLTSPFSV